MPFFLFILSLLPSTSTKWQLRRTGRRREKYPHCSKNSAQTHTQEKKLHAFLHSQCEKNAHHRSSSETTAGELRSQNNYAWHHWISLAGLGKRDQISSAKTIIFAKIVFFSCWITWINGVEMFHFISDSSEFRRPTMKRVSFPIQLHNK